MRQARPHALQRLQLPGILVRADGCFGWVANCVASAPARPKLTRRCLPAACSGRDCQVKDWKGGHKQQCKKLRALRNKAAAREAAGAAAVQSSTGSSPAPALAADLASSGGEGSSSSALESNSTPPVPRAVLYPYAKFLELWEAPPLRPKPCGLANTWNTCFANSLLQVWLFCLPG